MTPVRPDVLVVTGPPASGKSTLGLRLARDIGLPYLSKDLFKESLFDTLGWQDRAWSQRLGLASTRLLFRAAAALLEAGQSVALESNFYPRWDTPEFQALGHRYGCQFIQLVCSADPATLAARFEHRARSGERHPGHRDHLHLEEWRTRLDGERWEAMALGGHVVAVDTSRPDSFDYAVLLARVAALLTSAKLRPARLLGDAAGATACNQHDAEPGGDLPGAGN
jgi:predicted kinase